MNSFDGKQPGECPVDPSEIIRHLTSVLDDLVIPYFITGSVATILYGEARMTQDVDVVADISFGQVKSFCRRFPEQQYYLSEDAVSEALAQFSQFNIINIESGFKADIIVPKKSPHNKSRFLRRKRIRLEGEDWDYWFSSPEDVILKKMEFHRDGGSDKHLRDIRGVLMVLRDRIDREYIDEWASRLDLEEIWRIMQE